MAGKNKLDSGPMLLGGLDLDDVDDLLGDNGSNNASVRTPKESIRKLTTATKRSIKERINTKSLLASFIRTALPDGYTRLLGLYDESAKGIKSVVDGVEETEFANLEKLAEKFEDQLPKLKGKLPDAVYDRVKAKIEDRKETYKLQRQITQAQASRKKGEYDEVGETAQVDAMLAEMSEAQLDLDKANTEVEHNKLDYEVKRDGIRARLDKSRFDVMNRHLGMIADSGQRNTAYNDTVTYQFQKKSLELQMRGYLATRSLIKLQTEQLQLHRSAYTALVHNTGLPEFLKGTNAERIKFTVAERARDPFKNIASKTASDFAANFLPNLFNNIGQKTTAAVRGAGSAGDGMIGVLLRNMMTDPEGAAGGMLGDGIASFLQNTVVPTVARKVKPGIQKASNKYGKGADSRLAYFMDNIASMTQGFANDASMSTGWKGEIQNIIKAVAPQFRLNDLVKTGNYQTIDQAASFNQGTQRSIVEVIPGYLSRILHETRMIRTGDHNIARESYDLTRGVFTDVATAKDNLGKRIVGQGARRSVKWALNNTVGSFDSKGKLSPEAKHALEERLLRDAMEGKHFDPVAYIKTEGYAPGTDAAVLSELETFFKRKFKFDAKGDLKDIAVNYQRRQEFSTKFNSLRSTTRSPIAEIERLLSSGNHTALRELGVIKTVEGEDRIDYGVLRDMYRDLGDPSASGGNPTPPPGPTSPLLKGLRKSLRENRDKLRQRFGEARGRAGEMRGQAMDAAGNLVVTGNDAIQDALDKSGTILKQQGNDLKARTGDLIVTGKEGVVIKADEILNGTLIDATTQKVITNIKDIKGEVIDITGRVRLTRAEVMAGISTTDGRHLDVLKYLPTKVPPQVMSLLANQRQTIDGLIRRENGALSRVKDLYLDGANDPVIKAVGIRAGEYIDIASQKVIETIDDISGPIAHISKPEEVLVTAQEAATKLTDNKGQRFKSSKVMRYLAWATKSSFSIAGGLGHIGLAIARKTFNFIAKRLGPMDAFLPGNSTPVLTGAKLKRAEYYHENGKVITSFDDLRDGVYTADGQLLIDADDIPNLINRDGTKHTAAKRRSLLRKLAKKVAFSPLNAAKWVGKKWWQGTKAYYRGMGKMVANKFGKSAAKAEAYNEQYITPTDSILGRILGVLDNRLPKEGPREGSWQQKLQEAEAAVKAKKEGKPAPKDKEMAGGGLLAGLKSLFGKKEEEEEEESNEISLDFGGGDDDKSNDSSDEDTDQSRRRRRRKPRGKMGRAWDKVKGSRVGKAVGRIGGNTAVRGVAGNIGRMVGGSALASTATMLGIDIAAISGPLSAILGGVSLSGVGTGLAAAGSSLLGAGAAAGSAILGVLASPVVLGALAAGAVIGGGIWLWNRSSKTSGDFRDLRMLQYGIDSTGDKLKILELEAYLEQFTDKGKEPRLNIKSADPKKIFEITGIDEEEPEEVMRLATWIDVRFKPVYFAWIRAMHELTPTGVFINELDDKLPDEAKYDFFKIVKTVPNEVYAKLVHPLDEDPIEVTTEEINDKVKELLDDWRDKAKSKVEEKKGDTTGATTAKPAGMADSPTKASPSIMDRIKSGAKMAAMATPIGLAITGLMKAVKDNWFGKLFDNVGAAAQIAATPAIVAGLVLKSAVDVAVGVFKTGKLSTLQAVRVRAYGRMQLDEQTVGGLFEAEALLYKQITFSNDGQASFTGNIDTLIGTVANYFGVDVTDATSRKAQEFTAWMLQRFIPVGLAYYAAVKQKAQAITPSRVETALSDQDKLAVANAIMTATYEYNGDNISIWKAETFFNNGTADLGSLKATAEVEIVKLKELAEKAKLASPATSVKDQENQNKSKLRQTADKIMERAAAMGASIKQKLSDAVSGAKEAIGGAVSSVKDWLGMGDKAQAPAQSQYSQAYSPGGQLEQRGSTFSGFAEGNGGVWNNIPLPKANRSRDAAMETLRAVQAMTGVDAELLATFCSIESNFDYLVKAGSSSATGWFQFINGTWDGMLAQHGSKYGIPPDNRERYLRKDPRINALMGAEFLKGNYKHLAKALGRAPTDTDLYCAHFMGAGGAAGFLTRDRNAIAASFYPKEASANTSIYYKKTGQPRTIGEIYALFEAKVASHRKGGTGTDVGKAVVGDPQKLADEQAAATAKSANITPPDDAVTGNVGVGSATDTQDSITMTADKAAAPMRMGDPSQGGPTAGSPGGGTGTAVTSGQQVPERQKALEDAAVRAASSDRARTAELKDQQAIASSSINYLEQQLSTQVQMRDLLKVIAQQLGRPSVVTDQQKAATAPAGDNGMGVQQSKIKERTAGNTTTPLSFSR